MTIDPTDAALLRKPDVVLNGLLKAASLHEIEATLKPLCDAAIRLQKAASFKGSVGSGSSGDTDSMIPRQIWMKIKNIQAISDQRQEIASIKDAFVSSLSTCLPTFLSSLLKHKALNDDKGKTIDAKSFNFAGILVKQRRRESRTVSSDDSVADFDKSILRFSAIPAESNILLVAQRVFHEVMADVAPLVEVLTQISPSSVASLSESYVGATQEKLYSPLFKTMLREFRTIMVSSRSPVTLSSIARYKYKGPKEAMVRYYSSPSSSTKGSQMESLQPWEIFQLFLFSVGPVVSREEAFFMSLFSLSTESSADDWINAIIDPFNASIPTKSTADVQVSTIFSGLLHLVNKLVAHSSSDTITRANSSATVNSSGTGQMITSSDIDIDIVETIGLFAVLYHFTSYHATNSSTTTDAEPQKDSDIMAGAPSRVELSSSMAMLLHDMKKMILSRLETFLAEQLKWIQNFKSDVKKAGVAAPFSKFASLVYQIQEIVQDQVTLQFLSSCDGL